MKLGQGDELVSVDLITNPLEIITVTNGCDVLRFRASDVSLYGTAAGGIKAIALKPKDYVVQAFYANKNDDLLVLTNRGYIKRQKIDELTLSKRARSGQAVIKKIKSNPHLAVSAAKLTANQYKENVDLTVIYNNGIDVLKVFDIKYTQTDAGTNILADGLGEPIGMMISQPKNPDIAPSDDYLIEKDNNIDFFSFENMEEKPIKASKSKSIEDELDEILKNESKAKDEGNIKFEKISLFDDEE